jgi:hypothetical protein
MLINSRQQNVDDSRSNKVIPLSHLFLAHHHGSRKDLVLINIGLLFHALTNANISGKASSKFSVI